MTKRGRTIYVKKSKCDLSGLDCPSAGPHPNVRGMRRKCWGFHCTLLRQGAYVYKPTGEQLESLRARGCFYE